MNPAQFRIHIEAYLNLRSSLGFQTEYESYNLRELSDYLEAKGFSWPIRTQTILDWIGAASLRCGLPGQRMRLTQARCFLKYLKASVPETEVPGPGLLPHQPRPQPVCIRTRRSPSSSKPPLDYGNPVRYRNGTPYLIIGLLASTGLRAGEVITLTVDDVRLDSDPPNFISVRRSSTSRGSCPSIPAPQTICVRTCRNVIGSSCAGRRKRSSLPAGGCLFPIRHSAECFANWFSLSGSRMPAASEAPYCIRFGTVSRSSDSWRGTPTVWMCAP